MPSILHEHGKVKSSDNLHIHKYPISIINIALHVILLDNQSTGDLQKNKTEDSVCKLYKIAAL